MIRLIHFVLACREASFMINAWPRDNLYLYYRDLFAVALVEDRIESSPKPPLLFA